MISIMTSDLWEPWHNQNWAGASTPQISMLELDLLPCFCIVMVWTTQEPKDDDNINQDADVVAKFGFLLTMLWNQAVYF